MATSCSMEDDLAPQPQPTDAQPRPLRPDDALDIPAAGDIPCPGADGDHIVQGGPFFDSSYLDPPFGLTWFAEVINPPFDGQQLGSTPIFNPGDTDPTWHGPLDPTSFAEVVIPPPFGGQQLGSTPFVNPGCLDPTWHDLM